MVKLTRQEMQRKFVVADTDKTHAYYVGMVACQSYIQSGDCDDHAERFINTDDGTVSMKAGSSPFIKVLGFIEGDDLGYLPVAREIAKMPEARIVVWTLGPDIAADAVGKSHLTIFAAGNGTGNISWYDDFVPPEQKVIIAAAIREHRLIYTAGWYRDTNGNYVRHADSSSCRGDEIQEGCIWTQFDFHYGGGTSYSAPQFAAALASVLAIAPETTPQNLAKFGKACVKRTGEGIEELLRVSGGLGVADFGCVGDVIVALANLPNGGTANVVVNGSPVTLSGREIVLSFAGTADIPEETDGLFVTAVPNGEDSALLVTGYRNGDLFASLSAGTRPDFFGFTEEHGQVRQTALSAGHGNLFLSFTELVSDGGNTITGATGQSLTLTAQQTVSLTEQTALTATFTASRFLGGEAAIPLGTLTLDGGTWQPRLSLATETEIIPALSLRTVAGVTDEEDYNLSVGARLTF